MVDHSTPDAMAEPTGEGPAGREQEGGHTDSLVNSVVALTDAIRELATRTPVSPHELLTAEQLGALFRLSPRTLRDLAAAGQVPHHRIGKHYRFSRDDIADILAVTKQVLRRRHSYRRAV